MEIETETEIETEIEKEMEADTDTDLNTDTDTDTDTGRNRYTDTQTKNNRLTTDSQTHRLCIDVHTSKRSDAETESTETQRRRTAHPPGGTVRGRAP